MNTKFIALLLCLTTSISAYSSSKELSIRGKVVEKGSNSSLPFATIILRDSLNKTISGTITGEDGSFIFNTEVIHPSSINVSFMGYRDTTLFFTPVSGFSEYDFGKIELTLNSVALKSALVSSRRPIIEQKIDKLIFNVSELVSAQGNNGLELLKKSPGVSVDPNGNILLNGSAVQIFVDGRPSNMGGQQLEQYLVGTDGATIDKIEIMAHPSSKYDASGSGGIINIKLKRNLIKGINGYVRAGYSVAPYNVRNYNSADGTLNLNYRGEKSNTSITYSPRYNESFSKTVSKATLSDGFILDGASLIDGERSYHNIRITSEYNFNKSNIIGINLTGYIKDGKELSNDDYTNNLLTKNGHIIEETLSSISNDDQYKTYSANLNFTHVIKDGQEFTINTDYGRYHSLLNSYQTNKLSDLTNVQSMDPVVFRTNSDQLYDIISAKIDYEQLIIKSYKLEAGVKWARSITDNSLIREDLMDNVWENNTSLTNTFGYTEDIYASYLSLARQFNDKWSFKAGLRAEHTNSSGDWISAGTKTKKSYIDVFPTAYIGFTPNKDVRFGLSYSNRIIRPKYYQLNPFRIYLDSHNSVEGNPNLMPQYSKMVNLTFGFKRHYSLMLGGQIIDGSIIENPYFNSETGEKLLIWENFGSQSLYGAGISISELPLAKWFIINANISVFSVINKEENFTSNSLFKNASLTTTLLLPKNFKFEISGMIQSGMPFGYYIVRPQGDLSIALKKSLFKNQGTLTLNWSDILNTRDNKIDLNTNDLESFYLITSSATRKISVSFQYRFGKRKSSKFRRVGNLEEASRTVEKE